MMRVGVVGAGTMGRGIAIASIVSGIHTTLVTGREPALVQNEIGAMVKRYADRSGLGEVVEGALSRLCVVNQIEHLCEVHLAIECVKEDIQLKRHVFAELDRVSSKKTVLATNTSTLTISDVAEDVRPEWTIALHFFNPAHIMRLVEIGVRPTSCADAVDRAKLYVSSIGKEYVIVRDKAGFVVNRMIDPLINNAMRLVDEDAATPEDIDTSMKLGVNHPMGPLSIADLIGLDVLLDNLNALYAAYHDEQYRPAECLQNLVAGGKLGRKTGQGFFTYSKR